MYTEEIARLEKFAMFQLGRIKEHRYDHEAEAELQAEIGALVLELMGLYDPENYHYRFPESDEDEE